MEEKTRTGLEVFSRDPLRDIRGARLGLLANQASIGPGYMHAVDMIDRALPGRLKVLFGPQHGFAGEKQDNMIESNHGVDGESGRPVYSLYGETRKPYPEMFKDLDVLLIDLVDVGTRVYTFAQTVAYCLETALETGLKIVILDRPNPIGGCEVEGNILRDDCKSFVGLFPIPMRHGMTLGELTLFMADCMPSAPDIEIVKVEGWKRSQYFNDVGLEWVFPSPNMPSPETAWVYPGQVIWEGTNISEGRGTTRPFQLFGAPFIDPYLLREELLKKDLPGVVFRPASFQPTFHKFAGEVCGAIELHPLDVSFKPYLTSLTILELLLKIYPGRFSWKQPPYEYEYERMPIDLITGDKTIRMRLEDGAEARELEEDWRPDLNVFCERRERFLLY